MSLLELLRFAEEISFFLDADKIRVCLPPFDDAPADDCLLLLDGINEVPPPSLWYSIDYEVRISAFNAKENNENHSNDSKEVSDPENLPAREEFEITTPYHAERSNSGHQNTPILDSYSPKSPINVPFLPKVLFSPAHCELNLGTDRIPTLIKTFQESAADLGDEPSAPTVELQNVKDATSTLSINCIDALSKSKAIPAAEPILPAFLKFLEQCNNRLLALHSEPTSSGHYSLPTTGDIVFYHVTQSFRVEDNLALSAAMRLSAELAVPLIALVILDSEIIADAISALPDSSHSPLVTLSYADMSKSSAGDKRKLSEVEGREAAQDNALKDMFDRRATTLRGLHRKNCVRMEIILKFKEQLKSLGIPLVVIEYDSTAPHSDIGGSSAVVTPQHSSTDSIHTIAHILIALCSAKNTTTQDKAT